MKYLYLLLFIILLASCEFQVKTYVETKEGGTKAKDTTRLHGEIKRYRQTGELLSVANFHKGKKHGLAKDYYKNGNLHHEIHYVNNIKHGEAITYYENGKVYKINSYNNGKLDGVQKIYRNSGKLMAEIPYRNNFPGIGLKEYTLSGKEKSEYAKIVFETVDHIAFTGEFILRASLSNKNKNVEFFFGTLDEGKYMNGFLGKLESKGGVYEIRFQLPKGAFIMETIDLIAVEKTVLGNPHVMKATYNLAIENTSF